jgi:tetraacyldisaccharide 4'-kinase
MRIGLKDIANGSMENRQVPATHYQAKYGGLSERIFKLILEEEKSSLGLALLRSFASCLAWPYGSLVRLRNLLFDLGIITIHEFDCRVISVGNLAMGGIGKTPMVLWLAKFIAEEGWRVAIVSRGYRGRYEGKVLVVSDGQNILVDSSLSGDEPQMMARRFPGLPVLCSPKRARAVETVMERFRGEVVILDDAFQHRYVARDLDVVMLDSRNPYGNGQLFPRGILRESAKALRRAQALILSRFDGSPQAETIREELADLWSDKLILTARHRPIRLFNAASGEERPLSSLEDLPVAAFAGIGRPEDFFLSLSDLGAKLVYVHALPDHHPLTADLLNSFCRETADLESAFWIITEKDWVRLPEDLPEDMELWVLTIGLDFGEESSQLEDLVRGSLLQR